MPDAVFGFRMPAGIPGEVTRFQTLGSTIQQESQNVTTPVNAYGQAVVVDVNGARPVAAGDTAMPADTRISVRPFPAGDIGVAFPQGVVGFGAGTPPTRGVIDTLRRGYISVKCNVGTPAKAGAVYVYYGTSTGSHVQSGFEAAPGANLWQLVGAEWTGAMDANGNSEISYGNF